MTEPMALTQDELALVLEALEDAAFYRDTHSRVLDSAARRSRRSPATGVAGGSDAELHRRQARAYGALALKLRKQA
ncbi:MAG TPA: hypothetical protein VNF26_12895 [Candidatus Baltobacterales bacterium]|nr:hypothetical protein [Candidatus Baltobacterales bacterium]